MNDIQQLADGVPMRRLEYEDELVLAADLGVGSAHVDVVGETLIVVTDDDQYELTLPAADARASIRNGVLTVEVSR